MSAGSAGQVVVIGAGIAGISAGHRLQQTGAGVRILEAANYTGGRCRTFYDDTLDMEIDNGTHLVLSGNESILEMAAADEIVMSETARFPFRDLGDGREWAIDLGARRVPWMHESPPGADLWTLLHDLRKLKCDRPVAEVLDTTAERWRTLWVPLTLAALNTRPEMASARLLHAVLSETMLRGGQASRPVLTRHGLGPAFVEPWARGLDIRLGNRVERLERNDGRISSIVLRGGETIAVGGNQHVVLAVPWPAAHDLLADTIPPPPAFNPIVNIHFRLAQPQSEPSLMGFVGARSHWLAMRGEVASVTISAAHDEADMDPQALAREVWAEVAPQIDLALDRATLPSHRVIREKRATFAATPEADAARPPVITAIQNLVIAGDWVQTGFPATLEGAARSGKWAAEAVLKGLKAG